MSKLLIKMTACAFGLALGGAVIAADQMSPTKDTTPEATQSDTKAAPNDNPAGMTEDKTTKPAAPVAAPGDRPETAAGDKGAKPEDVSNAYSAALKKCDAMSGDEKDKCEKKAGSLRGKM